MGSAPPPIGSNRLYFNDLNGGNLSYFHDLIGGTLPGVCLSRAFPRREAGDPFNGPRNSSQRRSPIRNVNEREDQTRYPKDVVVRE